MDRSPMEPPGPADSQRLAKLVAALVPCSRSQAEQYITQGWVRVDGQVSDAPHQRVNTGQRVEIDPHARLQPLVSATFLIHKPAGMPARALTGLLEKSKQWSGDTSGLRRSKTHLSGLQMLMPMPDPASGLCILSQDLRVIRKLTEDDRLVEQELIADVGGQITADGLVRLCHGLQYKGQRLPPARVSWQSEARLRFAVKGIAPEWIEGMCAQVGLELIALRRIRLGRIPMAGLPLGQWRYLPPGERF
jgi:23S rRNA pseudouridine2604 synthase